MGTAIISEILKGQWFIDPQYAHAHIQFLNGFMNGNTQALSSNTNSPQAQYNKIAIVSLEGPVLKNGGPCLRGTKDIAQDLIALDANPEIATIILDIDSPGGTGSGATFLADTIRNIQKPIYAHINHGMACSAAYWIASQCDYIYAANKMDTIGSIGGYIRLMDNTGELEDKKWKIIEVYSSLSGDKNKQYKDAFNGDTLLLQNEIDDFVKSFIQDVKSGRGYNLKNDTWNTGKTFTADKATEIGLIDGILSFNELIDKITKTHIKKTSMNSNQYPNIAAAAGWSSYETTEDGLHLQHEDAEKINVALQPNADKDAQIEAQQAQIAEMNATIASLEFKIADAANNAELLNADIQSHLTTIQKLNDQVAEMGAAPSPEPEMPIAGDNHHDTPNVEYDDVTREAMAIRRNR